MDIWILDWFTPRSFWQPQRQPFGFWMLDVGFCIRSVLLQVDSGRHISMYFYWKKTIFTTPESQMFDRATQERQLALEREMYKHICKLCDDVNPDNIADIFRSMRMAKQFEEVRTIEMEELSKISLSCSIDENKNSF